MERLFNLRQVFKKEGYDIIEGLVKLLLNFLYGGNIVKYIVEEHCSKSDFWLSK